MSKYETEIDVAETNTSHNQMLELVGYNKRVLDVGCASGYLARVLAERGCTVSGVEADPEAAEEARPVLEELVVGDLEQLDLGAELGERRFDVVVFGDVLEHLRDPLRPLRQARGLLVPGGSVVLSVPNIGHGAVRLALLKGEWQYRPLGLLDETHLRFFTHENVTGLLREAGFVATETRRTYRGVFDTEIEVNEQDYPPAVIEQLLDDPEATTYQFVVRAVPDDGERSIAELSEREQRQRDELVVLGRELDRARAERDALAARIEHDLAHLLDRNRALEAELSSIQNSTTWRLTRRPRQLAVWLRRRAGK